MMATVGVLIIAVTLLILVLFWSGRYGGKNRTSGTSLHRSPRAHITSKGRAKKGYAKREDAESRAQFLKKRDGVPMSVYRCDTCSKWHVGHAK